MLASVAEAAVRQRTVAAEVRWGNNMVAMKDDSQYSCTTSKFNYNISTVQNILGSTSFHPLESMNRGHIPS
jgi:hypothetical protein